MNDPVNAATPASARKTLEVQGIPFTEEEFVRSVRDGRRDICEQFLSAGISPDAIRDGQSALVIAAAKNRKDIVRMLLAAGADPLPLTDAVAANTSQKDGWDKLSSLSGLLTFVSSVLIASVGTTFTYYYNQRQQDLVSAQSREEQRIKADQNRLVEMQTVEKMIPHLKDDQSRPVALVAISELASPRLASRLGEMYGGRGSVKALEQIAAADAGQPSPEAVSALAGLASRNSDDATPAREALEAVLAGKDQAVVTLSKGRQAYCNGFVADASGGWVVTPGYCLDAVGPISDVSVQTANGKSLTVKSITLREDGLVGVIQVDPEGLTELALATKTPAVGEIVMRLAFDLSKPTRGAGNANVALGTVVRIGDVELATTRSSVRGTALHVNIPSELLVAGSGGGPILDRERYVACMTYQANDAIQQCLPASTIQRALFAAKRS